MKKLDTLINEEVAMASTQHLKLAHNINNSVTEANKGVGRVDRNVLVVKREVLTINNNIKEVDDKLQKLANGGQHLFSVRSASYLTLVIP